MSTVYNEYVVNLIRYQIEEETYKSFNKEQSNKVENNLVLPYREKYSINDISLEDFIIAVVRMGRRRSIYE
jgi:hypothetical protein